MLRDRTAGDPMRQEVRWTDLTYEQIAATWPRRARRSACRWSSNCSRSTATSPARPRSPGRWAAIPTATGSSRTSPGSSRSTSASDDPIVSMDTKKKELIGNFYRAGHLLTQEVIGTFDHDFPSFASGVIIPHGLYDVKHNDGHVNLGTSHDTGEFACDSMGFQ